VRRFVLALALASAGALAQFVPGLPVTAPSAGPGPTPPAQALNVYAAYGQSEAAGNQSSARNTCLGSALTPAGVGQIDTTVGYSLSNYMLQNWGSPQIGANTSFQSSQATTLLQFIDCGPSVYSFSKKAIGQSLGVSINWLNSKDSGAGRGTVLRGYYEAGVGGQTITILSKPTAGEVCSATGTGPHCFCYGNASAGAGGTNGAQCVFPFNQAFVGSTSLLGAVNARAVAAGQTSLIRALTWHQGAADATMTQANYYSLLSQLFTDVSSAAQATTGQGSGPEIIIEQTKANGDGSSILGPALAQLQYLVANIGNHVHTMGPQYYRHAFDPTTVTFGGAIANGDSASVSIVSSSISGTTATLTLPVITGDTTTTMAAKLVAAVSANSALSTAGVYAQSSNAVVSLYAPGTLQPPFTVTASNGASLTMTTAYSTISSHEVNVDKVWKAEQIGQCEDQILKSAECPMLYVTATASNPAGHTVTLTYGGLGTGLLTSPLVEDTTTIPAATNKGFAVGVGMTRVTLATAAGSPTLRFGANLPTYAATGMYVYDLDNPTAIPAGTTILSIGATTMTMSANAAGGGVVASGINGNGDRIVFSTCQRAISSVSVGTGTVTITLDGDPTGCTISYALWGPGQQQTSGVADSAGNFQLTGYYGAYGNIRDSYSATGTFSGKTLRNFAMAQQWVF
jgi:hypothetical protein